MKASSARRRVDCPGIHLFLLTLLIPFAPSTFGQTTELPAFPPIRHYISPFSLLPLNLQPARIYIDPTLFNQQPGQRVFNPFSLEPFPFYISVLTTANNIVPLSVRGLVVEPLSSAFWPIEANVAPENLQPEAIVEETEPVVINFPPGTTVRPMTVPTEANPPAVPENAGAAPAAEIGTAVETPELEWFDFPLGSTIRQPSP